MPRNWAPAKEVDDYVGPLDKNWPLLEKKPNTKCDEKAG
jgi:hypothetical protein